MALFISSAQNPRIKRLLTLQQKGSERRRSSLFVLEGRREISRALSCGYEAESFFLCPDICPGEDLNLDEDKVFTVSPEVYAKIAYREGTEGLIAVLRSKEHRLENGFNPLPVKLFSGRFKILLKRYAVEAFADGVGGDVFKKDFLNIRQRRGASETHERFPKGSKALQAGPIHCVIAQSDFDCAFPLAPYNKVFGQKLVNCNRKAQGGIIARINGAVG